MQPRSREMPAMNVDSLLNLPEIHNHQNCETHFDPTSSNDYLIEQMLLSTSPFPWEFSAAAEPSQTNYQSPQGPQPNMLSHFDDQTALLASKLRHHQIVDAADAKALLFQQQLMSSRGLAGNGLRLPDGTQSGLLPVPSCDNGHHDVVNGFSKSANPANEALYNGIIGSLGQTSNQPPHFHYPQGEAIRAQNFGAPAISGGGTLPQPKQRVRARRGQATDPHSIAERLRRERIAERMKGLQELVPNANKTDKASMLDEIIDYVKFLQLQVKVLSMSRMGNAAAAIVPGAAAEDILSEGSSSNGNNNDGMKATEQQVAKLLEEDMGCAMQYLQAKGLCLTPISLATATCHSRNPMGGGPSSPSMMALTVQSVTAGGNGCGEASVKTTYKR